MAEVFLSRYLHHRSDEVVAALACQPGLGPCFHLHANLTVVPITHQQDGRLVLRGEIRVLSVARGDEAVCELLLVGEQVDSGGVDAVAVLDELEGVLEAAIRPAA